MNDAPELLLEIALEHRLMHAETLTYIVHNLPYDRRFIQPLSEVSEAPSVAFRMIDIPAGTATLGRKRGSGFGWDNEYEQHTRHVEAFSISKHKITNGQYLEFVVDGGPVPHYWTQRLGRWYYRGMDGELPLPVNWPVYVSYIQADAYARWVGKMLPSEEQFHRAAFGAPLGVDRDYPWGEDMPRSAYANVNFSNRDSITVTSTPAGDSALGVSQMVGNGWEWTRTAFHPFEGFQPYASYPGYSSDFFDGDHYVLKGGSCATHSRLIRSSFRNWFRTHYPYAYTTFRLLEE
jgi:formylglycine-generating enzyme required for sulfatase activity